MSTAATTKSAPVRKPRAKKAAPTAEATPIPLAAVTSELIAVRAFELFLATGGEHGRDLEHWLAAERELASSRS